MATILCIDQSEALVTRRLVLEKNGHEVRTAQTKDEALELLRQNAVDCVVARHRPALTEGLDTIAAIRQLYPNLPIVFLTNAPPQGASSLAEECLSNLDGPEALLRAVQSALKKGLKDRLGKNLKDSMRLWRESRELEEKIRETMRGKGKLA